MCYPGLIFIRAQFEKFKSVSIHVYAPTNGKERVLFQKRVNTIRQDSSSDDFLLLCRDLLLYRELQIRQKSYGTSRCTLKSHFK